MAKFPFRFPRFKQSISQPVTVDPNADFAFDFVSILVSEGAIINRSTENAENTVKQFMDKGVTAAEGFDFAVYTLLNSLDVDFEHFSDETIQNLKSLLWNSSVAGLQNS